MSRRIFRDRWPKALEREEAVRVPRGDVARELVLRPMTSADLGEVLGIENLAFAMPWSSLSYRNLLRRRDAELYVAAMPGTGIVGYTAFWSVLDEGELGNVAVHPKWRRTGIAQRLIEKVVERAAERGIKAVFLEVRVSNEGARRLYEHMGFVQVGVRRNYYAFPLEDALVMRKPVGREPSAS